MAAAPRIGLLGPYGSGNLGDAAIQDAVLANLRARVPGARFLAICPHPEDATARHGIAAVRLRAPRPVPPPANRVAALPHQLGSWTRHARQSLAELAALDLLVISGGGQLDDHWGGPFGHPLMLRLWTAGARRYGVPVAFCSVGADEVQSALTCALLAGALTRAAYVSARDDDTARFVRSITGLSSVLTVHDLAFSLPVDPAARRPPSLDGGGATVGVGLVGRGAVPGASTRAFAAYVEEVAGTGAALSRQGCRLLIFESQPRMDAATAGSVAGRIRALHPAAVVEHATPTSVTELLGVLARTHLVLASRLHSLLLAAVLHRPLVALSPAPKVRRLMIDLGLGDRCLPIFGATRGALLATVLRTLEERAGTAATIAARTRTWEADLARQYDRLVDLLDRRHSREAG
jgi:polysaccharide pyruvyl transferase WcaK-like protein